jgi:hypothetical protein
MFLPEEEFPITDFGFGMDRFFFATVTSNQISKLR